MLCFDQGLIGSNQLTIWRWLTITVEFSLLTSDQSDTFQTQLSSLILGKSCKKHHFYSLSWCSANCVNKYPDVTLQKCVYSWWHCNLYCTFTATRQLLCSGLQHRSVLNTVTVAISPAVAWPLTLHTALFLKKRNRAALLPPTGGWCMTPRLYHSCTSSLHISNSAKFIFLSKNIWSTVWLTNFNTSLTQTEDANKCPYSHCFPFITDTYPFSPKDEKWEITSVFTLLHWSFPCNNSNCAFAMFFPPQWYSYDTVFFKLYGSLKNVIYISLTCIKTLRNFKIMRTLNQ